MKVLFLDIDGVVNCSSTMQRHGAFIGIDPRLAARVKKIKKATGCKIVLSSTWRLNGESRAEVVRHGLHFIDITPEARSGIRGNEIYAWLQDHPEVTRYAILDDDSDFLADQPLFKTTWHNGITDEIAAKVIEYLNALCINCEERTAFMLNDECEECLKTIQDQNMREDLE